MRDKQQIKHVKQRLMYLHTFEKGLGGDKICETSRPIKVEIRISVSGQAPAYTAKGLRTHAHDMHAWGLLTKK